MEHMPAVGVFVVVLRNGGMAADLVGCLVSGTSLAFELGGCISTGLLINEEAES